MNVDAQRLTKALEDTLGWTDVQLTPMVGATSAALFAVQSEAQHAVVRLFDPARWDKNLAELSAQELKILEVVKLEGIATPQPLGSLDGNGVIMTRLSGAVALPASAPGRRWLEQLADTLARIHDTPLDVPWNYESWNNIGERPPPPWWGDRNLWNDAQQLLTSTPREEQHFLHRDYHPTNVLWEDGRLSGVVDWINACMGPAGVDVAHCRLNLAIMYGQQSADEFLKAYQHCRPHYVHAPYWDVDDAFSALPEPEPYAPWGDFGLALPTRAEVRERLEVFVSTALRST